MFCKLDDNKEIRNGEYQLREQMHKPKSENQGEYRIRNLSIEMKSPPGNWKKMNPVTTNGH